MSVIRANKSRNFTVMSNYHLKDQNLSLKAKGLLSLMLSLPNDWDYSVAGLSKICQEGCRAIRTAITELEREGYIERVAIRASNGTIEQWAYNIYELPRKDLASDVLTHEDTPDSPSPQDTDPLDDCPLVDFRQVDSGTQLNTNRQTTDKLNYELTNYVNTGRAFAPVKTPAAPKETCEGTVYGKHKNVFFTTSEYKKLQTKFPVDLDQRINRLSQYLKTSGRTFKSHYRTLLTWARTEAERTKTAKLDAEPAPDYSYEEGEVLC